VPAKRSAKAFMFGAPSKVALRAYCAHHASVGAYVTAA
jgi:hypothetical protein